MPPEVRAARFSRGLDRFVIEALRAVRRQGGERAFNHTARDLVISVCAILAYERGGPPSSNALLTQRSGVTFSTRT